jgi:phosphatidylserine/phosphatidylglycerophosphate/cardiolipin synthase-like enzyme
MKLLIQPDGGVAPILSAIKQAKKTIDILIFRLDRGDIARALEAAVGRGVNVRALTAHTNRGGEKSLRKLEMQLLEKGVTVSRTADDLVRYHGKMMVVDGRVLHVFGFNLTTLDIEKSRSFGIVTRNQKVVQEASKLFEADFNRQPYSAGNGRFVVSPENARERLTKFIAGARKELLIYDPKVTDNGILQILAGRAKAGVTVRIIGKLEASGQLRAERFPGKRMHVRAIVRDGMRAFVGSQSLRKLELENRREIGIIVDDRKVVDEIRSVFMRDWEQTSTGRKELKKALRAGKLEREAAAATS